MKNTGIFVTAAELEQVETAYKCSGVLLNNGMRLGDPEWEVARLTDKYHPPEGSGLNLKTGEFVLPE